MKRNRTSSKTIQYIKIVLFAVLGIADIVLCVRVAAYRPESMRAFAVVVVSVLCAALFLTMIADEFFTKSYAVKITMYCVEVLLLGGISLFSASLASAALFCIVLTYNYLCLESFTDKLILFAVGCSVFALGYILGWGLQKGSASVINSAVELISGTLFALLIMGLDFIIVQFLLGFWRTNQELADALKEAEEGRVRLQNAYEQLSETAVLKERNRIARDIHDNAGHSMTTVIMQTEAAKLLIDKDPKEAKNRIISANIQARNALEQMRESVHLLAGRESVSSLKEEMESVISQTIDGTDIKARCDIADIQAAGQKRRFLLNSLKECLSNGIRHGKATAFYIELSQKEDGIVLYISDNGAGAENFEYGFGLNGISSGALKQGGECKINSEAGEGFEVEIKIPAAGEE